METDLSVRLRAYASRADRRQPLGISLYSDALAGSAAAAAAASASIICSHTRVLRGDSPPAGLLPGQDELDLLAADPKPDDSVARHEENPQHKLVLPLRPGTDSLTRIVLGAAGIPAIKSQNA